MRRSRGVCSTNHQQQHSLSEAFDVVSGLSDHSLDIGVSVAAVALGASVIEKHFTLCREDGGPDSAFSLEQDELASLVRNCKLAREAIGIVNYQLKPSERHTLSSRRSLYAVKNIARGERLTPDNIRSIRPGYGLSPKHLGSVLGQTAATDIARGTPLSWNIISQ